MLFSGGRRHGKNILSPAWLAFGRRARQRGRPRQARDGESMLRQRYLAAATIAVLVLLGSEAHAGAQALSDGKPHDGVAAARDMPVQGIDVSYWQGDIDWMQARNAGVRFAYIKATEGGDVVDPKFLQNWQNAKNAGVVRGAYHFIY